MRETGQRVLGLAGWSGAGKTQLATALVTGLHARGHKVSTLKHAHHTFDVDTPGKDSYRHRQAGAHQGEKVFLGKLVQNLYGNVKVERTTSKTQMQPFVFFLLKVD